MMNNQINPSGFPPPPPSSDEIKQKMAPPGIAMVVTGSLGILTQFVLLLFGLSDAFMEGFQEGLSEEQATPEFLTPFLGSAFTFISGIFGFIIAVLIIYAGIRMMKLQNWGLAVTASVLAMVPCVSPCCFIGLPVGIWVLVVLNDDDVKSAFN